MTIRPPSPPARDPLEWLNNQPYLLLSLTSLFWAGNIVLGRYVAGHVPPMTLSCVRWIGAFFMLLPFAWPHLKRDWPALRARLPLIVLLSSAVGAVIGVLLIVFKGRDHSIPLAFGPYLAIAGSIALFFGPTLVRMYLR